VEDQVQLITWQDLDIATNVRILANFGHPPHPYDCHGVWPGAWLRAGGGRAGGPSHNRAERFMFANNNN